MKNLLITLALVFCLIFSCKKEVNSNKYDLNTFDPISSQKIFKRIEVILLDSVPNVPITFIKNIVYHDSLYYIHDFNRENLLVYNETGKFVRTIGASGRGPGELIDLRDFQINRFTGNIELMGNASPTIMIYDTLGTFIKQRNLGHWPTSITNFYHINSDLTAWVSLADRYNISVYSDKLNKIVNQVSLGIDRVFQGHFRYNQPFSHYKDTTFFFDTYSNILYRFNEDQLDFEIHKQFDFGEANFDKSKLPHVNEWESLSNEQRSEIAAKAKKIGPLDNDKYIETEDFIVLNKWTNNVLTRKEDNSVVQFNLFTDSINYVEIGRAHV